jgi:hypothetical protein
MPRDTMLYLTVLAIGLVGTLLGALVTRLTVKRHRLLTCGVCGGRGFLASRKRGEKNNAGACARCGGHGVVHS